MGNNTSRQGLSSFARRPSQSGPSKPPRIPANTTSTTAINMSLSMCEPPKRRLLVWGSLFFGTHRAHSATAPTGQRGEKKGKAPLPMPCNNPTVPTHQIPSPRGFPTGVVWVGLIMLPQTRHGRSPWGVLASGHWHRRRRGQCACAGWSTLFVWTRAGTGNAGGGVERPVRANEQSACRCLHNRPLFVWT